jgi:hypothetical protein
MTAFIAPKKHAPRAAVNRYTGALAPEYACVPDIPHDDYRMTAK